MTMSGTRKPEVLIIPNVAGWALDINTDALMRPLGEKYRLNKKYQDVVTEIDLDRADLIQIYYWSQLRQIENLASAFSRHLHKLIIAVCSHTGIEGELREPGLQWLRRARAIYAISPLLYQEVRSLVDVPVFYAPNGVDTAMFTPAPSRRQPGRMRVGWAGSLSNHGPELRGFYDLIVPGVSAVDGVELVTAIREERWRPHAEMVEFYRSLDAYICASRSEGAPNPCLEAAACGIPIVSTRVGNMPQLIEPGVNGFFIERDVKDIARVLTLLRDDEPLRSRLGKAIRKSILSRDWSVLGENFHQLYQFALGGPDTEKYLALNMAGLQKELLETT